MQNISFESTFHWCSEDTVKFEVDVGFAINLQKITVYTRKIDISLQAVRRCYVASWR